MSRAVGTIFGPDEAGHREAVAKVRTGETRLAHSRHGRPLRTACRHRFVSRALAGPSGPGMAQPSREKVMRKFFDKFVCFMQEEDGPTAVEYAVMLALIVVVCLSTIGLIGTNANTQFQTISDSLSSSN